MAQLALPQLTRGIRSRRRYPLLVSCVEKAVTVSLPLASIFPLTIPIFFSQHLCYLFAVQLSAPATLPWSIKGARARHHHPHPQVAYWKERLWVFPLFWLFSFTIQFFLTSYFFELTANPAELAVLNQLIKGARACHCCLLPRLAWRRQQLWVFLSFLCSPCFLIAAIFN